jgi:prevent-host-death family protein
MQLQTIGAYETKTHLSDLLRRVQAGQGFSITQRGVPVADLLPAGANLASTGTAAAARMRQFMQDTPTQAQVDIKALQDQGRD